MNVHVKLLKHQMELMQCNDDMVYLQCGRGAGKSYIASLMAVLAMLQGQRVICLGPSYRQVTEVLFTECLNRLYEILPPEEFEVHKVSMKICYKNGIIYFASYENVDNLRGFTKISLAICDEIALASPELMNVLSFCQRDTGGKTRQIWLSTPRSLSWVTTYVKENNVKVISATTRDNPRISEQEIELMRKSCISETAWQREFYGIPVDDENSGAIFTDSLLEPAPINGTCVTIGIDCSGLGKDCNCLILRKGNHIEKLERIGVSTAKDLFAIVKTWIHEYGASNISGINIDQAFGLGLYELLMDSDYKSLVNLVPFGGAPEDKAYLNVRAEIYLRAKRYIMDHGISGLDEKLKEELKTTRYIMTNHDRIQLIPKEDIRLILKRSPDSADAFALSFYTDDQPRGLLLERRGRQGVFME